MEQLMAKLREYLKMDEEIEFKEFDSYYHDILDTLQNDFQDMDDKTLIGMRYIIVTVGSNAKMRSSRKDSNAKKFNKMADKMIFWRDAIEYKLKKEFGYTQAQIEEADEALNEEE